MTGEKASQILEGRFSQWDADTVAITNVSPNMTTLVVSEYFPIYTLRGWFAWGWNKYYRTPGVQKFPINLGLASKFYESAVSFILLIRKY
jgi:hypothetical protein